MAKLNKIKPDTILKNFWKNNDRFADLFNTFLFNGEEIFGWCHAHHAFKCG